MIDRNRRLGGPAGMAVGVLLAAPFISLAASAIASADPTTDPDVISTYGDVETLDSTTGASDNYLTTPIFDNDFYAPSTTSFEDVFTLPGSFQDVVTDTNGVLSFGTPDLTPSDFIPTDIGLTDIDGGGTVGAAADIWSSLF